MNVLVLALTFGVMLVAVAAMAVGVMISGRILRGSCGGTESDCECLRLGAPKRCERAPPDGGPTAPIGHPRMPVHRDDS